MSTFSGNTIGRVLAMALLASALPADAASASAKDTAPLQRQRQPTLQLRALTNRDRELAAARARQRQGKPMSPKQKRLLAPPASVPGTGATGWSLPVPVGRASQRTALRGAASALLDLVQGQVGTADLYAMPNFANSPLPVATCECQPGTYQCDPSAPAPPALGCIKD